MKILFLTHTFPYPPHDGMRSTCYQLIKHVSQRHETVLLSLIESEEEKRHLPEISRWCKKVEVVRHSIPRSPGQRLGNILFDSDPFCVTQFFSPQFESRLKEIVLREKIDLVHFLSVNVSGYLPAVEKVPALFFPHDSVSMQFYRNVQRESNLLRKIYMFAQWKKMKRFEETRIPRFSQTVVVSEVDRRWLLELCPQSDISVIPGGVDCDYFKPQPELEDKTPSVLFRGVMNFPPNRDAALYFQDKVMPLVLRELPDLCYYIVGGQPTSEVQNLSDGTRTKVTGFVEDMRPWMAKATVHVCPMQSGSGMKNKILEAWAMEKAVVATSLACDGIQVEHGKNVLVADNPKDFARAIVRLVKDRDLRESLGRNGRQMAIKNYSWDYVRSQFEKVYEKMVIPAGNSMKSVNSTAL
ncbi:MAG: glycosyltransferase [Elusimicrobia bacterium]|nr:glycosyltransferase [Elusimicrobiota bacterium]